MYLKAVMTIDPSQLTEIARVKPTKGFARIAYFLTGGLHKTEEERETFCALSILQQINLVMRSIGIDSVVRLAKDDTVFYEDVERKKGDLKLALDQFAAKVDPDRVKLFETLNLILEHESSDLVYLLDIRIKRRHAVGEFPISITINGLPKNSTSKATTAEQVRTELEPIFASQAAYDSYVDQQKKNFESFVSKVESAFNSKMNIDDVHTKSGLNIIRPKNRIANRNEIPVSSADDCDYDPLFDNHRGFDETFFFAWMWADLCHDHDIHCADCSIVDSTGHEVLEVGPEGFQAGEGSTMNVDEPFIVPTGEDIQVMDGNEFSTEISKIGDTSSDTSGGWLDSIGGGFDGGSDAGSGCGGSSCGSSCGGGCGGGD